MEVHKLNGIPVIQHNWTDEELEQKSTECLANIPRLDDLAGGLDEKTGVSYDDWQGLKMCCVTAPIFS